MLRRYFGKISSLGINQLVGHNGELVIDEATDKIYIMDGVTPGGYEIANIQHYGSKIFFDNGSTIGPVNDGDNSISLKATGDNDFTEINYNDSQIVRANNNAVTIDTTDGDFQYQWMFDNQGQMFLPVAGAAALITTTGGAIQIQPKPGSANLDVNGSDLYLFAGAADEENDASGGSVHILATNKNGIGTSGYVDITTAAGSWTFGAEGKLTLPNGRSYEYPDTPLTGAGDEQALISFALQTNGTETQWLAAVPSPAGTGYSIGDTFEFDEVFLGIPNAILVIEVISVDINGAIEDVAFSEPPLYPADIYRDSPVILQVADQGRWVFGLDGTLTIPGSISSSVNFGIETVSNSHTSGVYFDAQQEGEGGNSFLYATNDVYLRSNNNGTNKDWVFGREGTLFFPGNAVINNNSNTLAFNAHQGTGQLIQITAGDGGMAQNGGDLRLYAGGPGDEGVRGNVDILGGKLVFRNEFFTFTFDTDGILHYPNALQWDNPEPPPMPLGGYFASSRLGSDAETGTAIENDVAGFGTLRWQFGTDGILELPTSEMEGFAAGIRFSDGSVQTKAYTDFGSNSLVAGDSAQYVASLDNDGYLHLSSTANSDKEGAILAPNLQIDPSIVDKIDSSYINIIGNTVVNGGKLTVGSDIFDDSYLWLVNADNAIYTQSDTGMGGHATTEYRNMGGYLEGGRGHRFYTGGTWDQQQLRFAIADDGILVPGDMYLTGQIRDFTGRNLLNPLNLNIDAGDSSTVYDTTDLIIDGGNS